MPWFIARAEITMHIEDTDLEGARLKAETILRKRVVGQGFGHYRNDQGTVDGGEVVEVLPSPPEEN